MTAPIVLLLAAVLAGGGLRLGPGVVQDPVDAPQPTGTPAIAKQSRVVPETMSVAEARPVIDRALAWLVSTQKADGSWGHGVQDSLLDGGYSVESYYDWQLAAHALACMALAVAEATPERHAALAKAVDWLCTTRLPKRGSDWDTDYLWSALYGYVCTVRLADDARLQSEEQRVRVRRRGGEFLEILLRNQIAEGGWAYYDDPPYTARPKWGTSFCTALVLPALQRGLELGWLEDERVLGRARDAVRRCALPNGAFSYNITIVPSLGGESINNVRGSLGRTSVCLWGLSALGDETVTLERMRAALSDFFEHHRFLDVARLRPVPHEAYYANAGYFYLFAHYYAAELIERLPAEERESWHARLRPHLAKVQVADGSTIDYVNASYLRTAGTAYLALALARGLPTEKAAEETP